MNHRGCAVVSEPVSLPGIPDGRRQPAAAASGAASASALDLTGRFDGIQLAGTQLADSKFPSWVTNDRKVEFALVERV